MKKTTKRILALLAAVAMMLSLAACAPKDAVQGDSTGDQAAADGTLFDNAPTIKLMVTSATSWPYNENWPMWKLFREKTGANLEVTAVPDVDFGTKVSLLMANSEEFPDMMFSVGSNLGNQYGPDGAMIAISDNLDKMPNFTAFWESIPEIERESYMVQKTAGDGKIYMPPIYGTDGVGNVQTWMYRKDIFEKHGLETPNTMDELYEVCKKLKELYPNSYPLCFRMGIHRLDSIGHSWKQHMTYHPYYNYNTNKWEFGPLQPEFKEMIEFFGKMVDDGLLQPDFMTVNTSDWETLMSADRGFITVDYLVRIDQFNSTVRPSNPEYTLAVMQPPKGGENGVNKVIRQFYENTGYVICNTRNEERINNAIKLLDWMYSPEGIEFQSWGEEGVTYEEVNGERKWLLPDGGDPYNDLGIATPGLYMCVDPQANRKLYSDEQNAQCDLARSHNNDYPSPFFTMAFAEDVDDERTDLWTGINSYCGEVLTKMMLGQTPMSEWENFTNELENMGIERLLEIYQATYDSIAK